MRFLVALLLTAVSASAQEAGKTHQDYRAEAVAAYQRKDFNTAREATLAALALRPDSPRYLHNMAALSALTNDPQAALDYLRRLAALGVASNVERDPDLAVLQGTPQFAQVLHAFTTNRAPRGEAEVLSELPGRTGIVEGLAFRPRTGDLFLSDVHHRCIWRRDRDGRVERFSAEDEELLGVFGLALDEPRNALWATMTAVPEMAEFSAELKGVAALAEFNLATSELRRVVGIPADGREHGVGDLTIGPDGTVYASDSKAPVIWALAPDSDEPHKVVDSPIFGSLQGILLEKRTLLVADYANGLFNVDVGTGNITALPPPENTTLLGIDGLVRVDGGIVATQNGVDPQRVIFVRMSPDYDAILGVQVLASGLANLTDVGLVTVANERALVVAGTGWDTIESGKPHQPRAHTVRIFELALPTP